MPSSALVQKRNELEAKMKRLEAAFATAKIGDGVYDFARVEELKELSPEDRVKRIHEWDAEVNTMAAEVLEMQKLEDIERGVKSRSTSDGQMTHPEPTDKGKGSEKEELIPLGQQIADSKAYKAFIESGGSKAHPRGSLEVAVSLKTLFETTAGWAPESTRIPRVIEAVTRPIQVTQLIPPGQTGQAAVVYMEETTRTHAAAERAEGAAYAESTFALTQQTSNVRSIGDSVPVTDEQLDDVPQVESYLNNRLGFGVAQRLDSQILVGNGTAPNLRGILNVVGIQTTALGAEPVFDAAYRAKRLVTITGRAMPNAYVFHPNDWEAIKLTRTADGIYILGNPADAGPQRLWGLPVTESDAITENTGLVGDFANFSQLFERMGLDIQVGFSGTQFVEGERTIRATVRVAFAVYRATAFCTITGI